MEDRCLQKNLVVTIATKVRREDRIKLEAIAKSLGMNNLYQLFQSLLLLLLRYFDKQTNISGEHEKLVQSYLSLVSSQKGSFTPIQTTVKPIFAIKKGILFIERSKGERPQIIKVSTNKNGKVTECYGLNDILEDVLYSIDPKLLKDLKREKRLNKDVGIIDTLRSLIYKNQPSSEERMQHEINEMFSQEVDEMLAQG